MIFSLSALKQIRLGGGVTPDTSHCKQAAYNIVISLFLLILVALNKTAYASINYSEKVGIDISAMTSDMNRNVKTEAKSYLSRDAIHYRPMSNRAEEVEVIIDTADQKVDIERQGNKIVLKLLKTQVEPGLIYKQKTSERLLRSIYSENKGKYGWVSIELSQDFEYQSYQLDNKITLSFQPAKSLTQISTPINQYSGTPISIDFQNVEVRSALHLLAQFMDTNIVASDAVTGTLMLNLINVSVDQAIDIILTSKQLGKQINGNVILVAPLAELAKQQNTLLKAQQQKVALMPLRSEYIRLNYAKAGEIQALIEKTSRNSTINNKRTNSGEDSQQDSLIPNNTLNPTLLSNRGMMAADTRTNTLIIKDTATSIDTHSRS